MIKTPIARVAIVDDEASVRKALARLLGASAFSSKTYASAREFLDSLACDVPECVIVDLQMPEMTGLELQRELLRAGVKTNIEVTYGDGKGSLDAYAKGFHDLRLLEAVGERAEDNWAWPAPFALEDSDGDKPGRDAAFAGRRQQP
jgi:FixJ family two-component response regulator